MKTRITLLLIILSCTPGSRAPAQSDPGGVTFGSATDGVQQELHEAVAELNELRQRIATEKIPLSRRLRELEVELSGLRADYQQTSRLLDSRTLDFTNLTGEMKARETEISYLTDLLDEYLRNFESGLHVVERLRYSEPLESALLAPENDNLTPRQVFDIQAELLTVSLQRVEDALGGTRFEGAAVDTSRLVRKGSFVLVGPAALFASDDGQQVGTAEERLNSSEPSQIAFADPLDTEATARLVKTGKGFFPLDPTLGNARKIAATRESLWEEVQKGGTVMIPIFVLAAAALLVALYRWLGLAFLKKPSEREVGAVLQAVSQGDESAAREKVTAIGGPVGRMLSVGVEHVREPRELVEEVMYENVLSTRLRLQRLLPFIAISAASAPLLGLLGTVTGIIHTFKLITVYGSGDVKTLSDGISEALITTKYGLIVAIPSLLIHAFLSRKARGVIDRMEKAAVALINQLGKTPMGRADEPAQAPPRKRLAPVLQEATARGAESSWLEASRERSTTERVPPETGEA
jgi:biopolymer transport protein ExbB